MSLELRLTTTPLNAEYVPGAHTRLTTNFGNLAKDPLGRGERIAATLATMDRRFHELMGASHDPERYRLALDIVTIGIRFTDGVTDGVTDSEWFPMTETLRCRIHDRRQDRWLAGPTGGNYSSYVRDHDFNVVLPRIRAGTATPEEIASFGQLHGLLFRLQFQRHHPAGVLHEPLIIAISASSGRSYRRSRIVHPVLGQAYLPERGESPTSRYFAQMGLQVSYFMPPGTRAPLAFYHEPGDLTARDQPYLAALVAIMDTFERIYRPEIYCARTPAAERFCPDLANTDYDAPPAIYDRVERDATLGPQQAALVRDAFLQPNAAALRQLMTDHAHLVHGLTTGVAHAHH